MSSDLNVVASRMGVGTARVEELLNGQASNGLASALGTSTACVQDILAGKAPGGCAACLGITADAFHEIYSRIGRQGVIGLLLGVAIAKAK